jgi:hypothetical protein
LQDIAQKTSTDFAHGADEMTARGAQHFHAKLAFAVEIQVMRGVT